MKKGPAPRPVADRLWAKVDKTGECWIWTAMTAKNGYGKFRLSKPVRRMALAHRVAYELEVGPIPEGLQLDHLCRNRSCVRPDHLEPVTIGENLRRGKNSNREKVACPRGHPYDYIRPSDGARMCRTCKHS